MASHNTYYWLEHWVTPQNKSITEQLPESPNNRHFGPQRVSYILYQYHHCQTTQPLRLEQLRQWTIDISAGQINQLLLQGREAFHNKKGMYYGPAWPHGFILQWMTAVRCEAI